MIVYLRKNNANNCGSIVKISIYRSQRQPLTAQRLSSMRISKHRSTRRTHHSANRNTQNISAAAMEAIIEAESTSDNNADPSESSMEMISSEEPIIVEDLPETSTTQSHISQSDKSQPAPMSKENRPKCTRRRRQNSSVNTRNTAHALEQVLHQESQAGDRQQEVPFSVRILRSTTPIVVEDIPEISRPQPTVLDKQSQTRISKRNSSKRTRRRRPSTSNESCSPPTADQTLDQESVNLDATRDSNLSVPISESTVSTTVSDMGNTNAIQQDLLVDSEQEHTSHTNFPEASQPLPTSSCSHSTPAAGFEERLEEELNRYLEAEDTISIAEESSTTTAIAIENTVNANTSGTAHNTNSSCEGIATKHTIYPAVQIPATPAKEASIPTPAQNAQADGNISCASESEMAQGTPTQNKT